MPLQTHVENEIGFRDGEIMRGVMLSESRRVKSRRRNTASHAGMSRVCSGGFGRLWTSYLKPDSTHRKSKQKLGGRGLKHIYNEQL